MIALIVISVVLVGIAGCSVLLGGSMVRRQQAELVRIERSKQAAERRLQELSRQAVIEMLLVAREADPNEHPWWA